MADTKDVDGGSGSKAPKKQVGFAPGHSKGLKTRFQKGVSGNPGGRKKGAVSIAAAIKRALTVRDVDELAGVLIQWAKEDLPAFQLLLERVDGRVPSRLDIGIEHVKVLERVRACPECGFKPDAGTAIPARHVTVLESRTAAVAQAEMAATLRQDAALTAPERPRPAGPTFTD